MGDVTLGMSDDLGVVLAIAALGALAGVFARPAREVLPPDATIERPAARLARATVVTAAASWIACAVLVGIAIRRGFL